MLLATTSLARRIDLAEARLAADYAEVARRHRPAVLVEAVGGTVAVFTGPGEPLNKLVGLGFGPPVDEEDLARIERAFDERDAPLQVEYATLADPAIGTLLGRRGYHVVGFENVLGLPLSGELVHRLNTAAAEDAASGVEVRAIAAGEAPRWIDVLATGFSHPDVFDGPPAHESFSRETLEGVFRDAGEVRGVVRYLARLHGEVAGGGSLRRFQGLAQLSGAATLPEWRRRGVQSALLRARLLDAARNGCDLAVVTTAPGSKSQGNVQAAGFELLYTRVVLVRP